MSTLWRIHTNTDSENHENIGQYCIDKGIIALGWSLKDDCFDTYSDYDRKTAMDERNEIFCFQDYCVFVQRHNIYGGIVNGNVKRMATDVKSSDLVWLRNKGLYYLGQITPNSHYEYRCDDEALFYDAANRITNIRWLCIGDESDVPGGISSSFIPSRAFQAIRKKGMLEFSMLKFNERTGHNQYKAGLKKDAATLFGLLNPYETEDLFLCWLQAKFNYRIIPSTRRNSTELYECVMVDIKTGRHIYPQVKSGSVDLCRDDFEHLPGVVWLFTSGGKIYGDNYDNVFSATANEIFDFAVNPDNQHIIPSYLSTIFDNVTLL